MLETSIFLLHFSYIKACQSYRFFIAKKKKKGKMKQKKTFGYSAFDEAL